MRYSPINISIELVCVLVVLTILFLHMGKQNKTRQDKIFALKLVFFIIQALCDVVAWWLGGAPGIIALVSTHIANFLLQAVGGVTFFLFWLYLIPSTSKEVKASRLMKWCVWVVGILSVTAFATAILNLWNGMYYWIDENNHYHWGDWETLPYFMFMVETVLLIIVVLYCRKSLNKKELRAFLSYGLLPFIAAIITIGLPKLMVIYPATTVALLLIYVDVQKEQEKKLELELTENRISIMLTQIQPHFLYNSLLAIQDLCGQDAEQAEKTIGGFSEYLRGNLDALTQKEPISFEKELEHVQIYLSLEKIRFEERLQIEYDIQAKNFMLPALTLQPIVENAIKHGVTQRVEGGKVIIHSQENATHWRITVEDNGVGFDPEQIKADGHTHVGIQNVQHRLEATCGGMLETHSIPGVGTTAVITIPKGGNHK